MSVNETILSFNSGVLSPKIDVRADVEKYRSGCRRLENMIPEKYGCATKRPGFKFIYDASTDPVINTGIIISFENTIANYIDPPQEGDVIFTITGPFDEPTGYIYFRIVSLTLGEQDVGPDNFTVEQLSDGDITERSTSIDFPFGYIWADDLNQGGYGAASSDWDAILYEDPIVI